MKPRSKLTARVRAELQKEINSACPFCSNDDVGHFEVHHIDNDPANGVFSNLIMLCPNCHSKITKGDITYREVINVKNNLVLRISKIEFYDVSIDSEKCSWTRNAALPFAFDSTDNVKGKSPFPLFQFSFINHFPKTVVLKNIMVQAKSFFSGMSGLPAPGIVPQGDPCRIIIDGDEQGSVIESFQPVQVPSEQAYTFCAEIVERAYEGHGFTAPEGRMVLYFVFEFSGGIAVALPKIFLNTDDEAKGVKVVILS